MAEFAGNNPDPCEPLAGRFPEYDDQFLAAIDKAMQILPKSRLQSTREWLDVINPSEQQRVKKLRPRATAGLGKTLTKLVSETNEYVLNSQPRSGQATTRTDQPAPTKRVNSRPEWAREFNRETSEARDAGRRAKARPQRVAVSNPTQPGLLETPPPKPRRSIFGFFSRR